MGFDRGLLAEASLTGGDDSRVGVDRGGLTGGEDLTEGRDSRVGFDRGGGVTEGGDSRVGFDRGGVTQGEDSRVGLDQGRGQEASSGEGGGGGSAWMSKLDDSIEEFGFGEVRIIPPSPLAPAIFPNASEPPGSGALFRN